MARPSLKYRLQPLLTIKERARKRAEIALAKAIVRLAEEKRRLEKLKEEKEAIIRRRREVRMGLHLKIVSGQARAKDGHIRTNYLRKLEEDEKAKEEEIERQKRTIEDCERQVARARRDYIDAVKELRVMEKHKELWWRKVLGELQREEEKELDELGMVVHELRKVA